MASDVSDKTVRFVSCRDRERAPRGEKGEMMESQLARGFIFPPPPDPEAKRRRGAQGTAAQHATTRARRGRYFTRRSWGWHVKPSLAAREDQRLGLPHFRPPPAPAGAPPMFILFVFSFSAFGG